MLSVSLHTCPCVHLFPCFPMESHILSGIQGVMVRVDDILVATSGGVSAIPLLCLNKFP